MRRRSVCHRGAGDPRQGIYFAMMLAFAQMIYFLCVQMPFTHGEDGLQGIDRRAARQTDPDHQRPRALLRRAGDLPVRLFLHLPLHPFIRSARC